MNFKTLKFQIHRIRAMSLAEIVYRAFKYFETQWDKWRIQHKKSYDDFNNFLMPTLPKITESQNDKEIENLGTVGQNIIDKNKVDKFELLNQIRARSVFLWQRHSEKEFRIKLRSDFSKNCDIILTRAKELLEHRFIIFRKEVNFDEEIDWNRDLLTGKKILLKYWSDIHFWDKNVVSEVKYTWELNRHQHFVTLAQAYFLSGDETYAEELFRQWDKWIESNPPKFGVNWTSSLELALRLVSWTWALHIAKKSTALTGDLYLRILESIDAHAGFIERHRSRFSSANNHLIGEGLGLIYAGTYFPELKGALHWQKKGFDIVLREIPGQVYADGVNKEQAISYQRYLFDIGLLTLQAADYAGIDGPKKILDRLERMAEFILFLIDTDGNVPSIGDEDGGQALSLSAEPTDESSPYRSLFRSAAILFKRGDFKFASGNMDLRNLWLFGLDGARSFYQLPSNDSLITSKSFSQGGYHVLRSRVNNDEWVMTFDTGPLGFGSMAAHGHADALSITLGCSGEPVLIDPGTYLYLGAGSWRDYFRSTMAHNTLTVDDNNQSEILGPFQWGKKAKSKLVDYREDQNFAYLEGMVQGFFGNIPRISHIRRIGFIKPNVWIIRDIVEGDSRHHIALHFHLGAFQDIEIHQNQVICQFQKSELNIKLLFGDNLKIEIVKGEVDPILGWRSNSFGYKEPCSVVRISGNCQLPCSVTTLLRLKTQTSTKVA